MRQRWPSASRPTIERGDHERGLAARSVGNGADRHRAAAGEAGAVVVVDRGERRHGVAADVGGDPSTGDADAVADEQKAVVAGHVVEVDVADERRRDRPQVSHGWP